MKIRKIYKNKLTTLRKKTIEYSIFSEKFENKTSYGISVSEKCEHFSNYESIKNISSDFESVNKLAKCLAESAIDTSHFKDIVEDYIVLNSI